MALSHGSYDPVQFAVEGGNYCWIGIISNELLPDENGMYYQYTDPKSGGTVHGFDKKKPLTISHTVSLFYDTYRYFLLFLSVCPSCIYIYTEFLLLRNC